MRYLMRMPEIPNSFHIHICYSPLMGISISKNEHVLRIGMPFKHPNGAYICFTVYTISDKFCVQSYRKHAKNVPKQMIGRKYVEECALHTLSIHCVFFFCFLFSLSL